MAAANLGICLTLQAEDCSLELWNTHKGFLKQNFPRLVDEIKAQRRAEQETGDQSGQQRAEEDPPPLAGGLSSCNDGREESSGSHHQDRATSSSSAPPPNSTATNTGHPPLEPLGALVALIKSELDLPSAMPIADAISMSMSLLGLVAASTMALNDKALLVARELDIPIT